MIRQIDKYWKKLFAEPSRVQTPSGLIQIQPQRANNILEQFFRSFKRTHRRRTGNASSSRLLRAVLAEIEIETLRQAFREAQDEPQRIPAKLKPLIAMPDFPEKFVNMVQQAVA